jgi:hypothetical protein
MERRDEDCGSTTSPKDVCPGSFVQVIIYIVDVTAKNPELLSPNLNKEN